MIERQPRPGHLSGDGTYLAAPTPPGAKQRTAAEAASPGMLLAWSVDPSGVPQLVLRCEACDDDARRTQTAFLSWTWLPGSPVALASVVSTAEAHRLECHREEGS